MVIKFNFSSYYYDHMAFYVRISLRGFLCVCVKVMWSTQLSNLHCYHFTLTHLSVIEDGGLIRTKDSFGSNVFDSYCEVIWVFQI